MKKFSGAAMLLLLVFCANVIAQTTNATLGGTVSDASRALIPGVTVTATNTQTGIVTTNITNETGAYQFASLQTGLYKVTAELPGFQTQTYNDVTLGVGQQVRLNFTLQVGNQAQSVEVNVAADTLIATTSSSVGTVLPEYKVRDLPLATRNILDLVNTTPGIQGSNFAGARLTQLNTTRDGVPVSDGRYDIGAATTTYTSPDLVDEVRVIVAPADAELGRGSGQIQMTTRSGTNQFRGSLFEVNRNSKLAANSWSNNFNRVGKNYYNGNQFGGRIGGPIIKNKTFFFFLFDGQRYITKSFFTGTVLTEQARQGLFRFFPAFRTATPLRIIQSSIATAIPLRPAGVNTAIGGGALQTVSVFRDGNGAVRDANRPDVDTSGWIKTLISRMPLPNDFNTGDGLNTAGIRWLRRNQGVDVANGDGQDTDRNQYNMRIDHNFNSRHKASFSGTWERDWAETTQAGISNWPGGFNGSVKRRPRVLTGSLVSTLSPTIVNEFRLGSRKNWNYSWSSIWRPDEVGLMKRARRFPPTTAFHSSRRNSFSRNTSSPHPAARQHAARRVRSGPSAIRSAGPKASTHSRAATNSARRLPADGTAATIPDWYKFPIVAVGQGTTAVTGIPTIPGLTGTSVTTGNKPPAGSSGSVSNVTLAFNALKPTDTTFAPQVRVKDYHQNEWGGFFKDDWKIRPDLTLNVGVRYDWYGVPWEAERHAGPSRPEETTDSTASRPGRRQCFSWSARTRPIRTYRFIETTGTISRLPWGLSWSLPWGGKDKTVLRAGYGMSYQGAASFNAGLNIAQR
jgi:hypothetical protein